MVTVKEIEQILMEETTSCKSRTARIVENNDFFCNCADCKPGKLASEIIQWNNCLVNSDYELIRRAKGQFLSYTSLLKTCSENIESVDFISELILKFDASRLFELTSKTSTGNSKISGRIRAIKLACKLYLDSKEKESDNLTKIIGEQIILEVAYQSGFFLHIVKKNLDKFEISAFPIGLLLYDIPSDSQEENYLLKRFQKLGIL